MDLIKKYKCVTGIIILLGALYYCWSNNWGYYYFDVVAKCSPAIAGVGAYYMWSENREREIKELEYKNDCNYSVAPIKTAFSGAPSKAN
jgi:hypothetical protein